jgi:hypothetical protein
VPPPPPRRGHGGGPGSMSDTGGAPRRLAPPPPPARPTSATGHSSTPNTPSVSHSTSHPGRAPPPPARAIPPPSRTAPPPAPPARSRVQSAVSPSSAEGEAPSSAISPIGFGAPPLPPGRGSHAHGRSVSGGLTSGPAPCYHHREIAVMVELVA